MDFDKLANDLKAVGKDFFSLKSDCINLRFDKEEKQNGRQHRLIFHKGFRGYASSVPVGKFCAGG